MQLTQKMKRLRAAYLGEARGDPGEACRIAGYKMSPGWSPSQPWQVLKRRSAETRQWIEALEDEFNRNLIMRGREIDERLTALARDPNHRDHYKALELLAKMSGKLKDQVVIVQRDALNKELDEMISVLKTQRENDSLLNPLQEPLSAGHAAPKTN